jgi:RimJ/RimL family protein N-acetyltransferase
MPMAAASPSTVMGSETDELVLADGTVLRIRALGAGDREGLAALFSRLSPESRRRRFLGPKPRLTARELTYLTEIDHVTHEALAAVDVTDGSIVGVSRYAGWDGKDGVAEIAIAVADDLQGHGIGRALAARIVQRACANGVVRLTATTQWDNWPARALLRRLAFRVRDTGRLLDLELVLRPLPSERIADGPIG